jgi:7-carboxy-7-deazaguanine synthase
VFIRLKGCNLNCSYCDTKWANIDAVPSETMTEEEIYDYIKNCKVKNVTLTGGEPLLAKHVEVLLRRLAKDKELNVEIETNGSIDLAPFVKMHHAPSFTMDYKLPDSGMEEKMCLTNFALLKEKDTVKFVSGSMQDLEKAKEIIERYGLQGKCRIFLSPVFGRIEPKDMVEFLIEHNLNEVNIQLQLHKFIWNPEQRGV